MSCNYFVNIADTDTFKNKLAAMSPLPGTCIFIDMCASTKLKDRPFKEWVGIIYNTITIGLFISATIQNHLVKVIGDELFIYVPDQDLNGESYATILSDLRTILSAFENDIDTITLEWKAAIHHCDDVYNMSFVSKVNDYYGKGVDLTARLIKRANANEIIVSESFYSLLDQETLPSFQFSEPMIERFNGFSTPQSFRRLMVSS